MMMESDYFLTIIRGHLDECSYFSGLIIHLKSNELCIVGKLPVSNCPRRNKCEKGKNFALVLFASLTITSERATRGKIFSE